MGRRGTTPRGGRQDHESLPMWRGCRPEMWRGDALFPEGESRREDAPRDGRRTSPQFLTTHCQTNVLIRKWTTTLDCMCNHLNSTGRNHGSRDLCQIERRRPRLRSQALAGRRRAPQQHGRGRVQARRPRPDLPQVHLRRLRGNSTPSSRRRRRRRAPIPKTPTSTAPTTSSGCPQEARWAHLKASAKQPTIGKLVDDAMVAIERDNPTLKGVLPKDYARPALDKQRLGELIDLIGNIGLGDAGRPRQGHARPRLRVLPRPVRQRRGQEGRPVLHAALRRARAGRDARALQGPRLRPLLRLRRHVRAVARSSSRPTAASSATSRIYGQESNSTTWRLAKMNLAIRGIDARLGRARPTPSTATCTPTSRPTTSSPTRRSTTATGAASCSSDDKRWSYGVPPAGNANYAWVQHFIHHLAPDRASPASCSPTASMSSNQSGEGEIRKAIIEADLVDCMVALPGQLFYSRRSRSASGSSPRNKKQRPLPRPARRDAVHRRPQARHAGRPRPPRADRRRHRARSPAPTTPGAATRSAGEVRRRPRLLQGRHARGDPQARPRAHARPLRRRRGSRRRRRAVRATIPARLVAESKEHFAEGRERQAMLIRPHFSSELHADEFGRMYRRRRLQPRRRRHSIGGPFGSRHEGSLIYIEPASRRPRPKTIVGKPWFSGN